MLGKTVVSKQKRGNASYLIVGKGTDGRWVGYCAETKTLHIFDREAKVPFSKVHTLNLKFD